MRISDWSSDVCSSDLRGAAPGGARVIDAVGKWVTPGIFGGFSRLGLVEVDAVAQTNDAAATGSPFGAAISVAPAVNPNAAAVQVNRAGGVTRAIVAPAIGRDLFAGKDRKSTRLNSSH